MHRYINGIYGSWRYITKDSWLPPAPLWGAGAAMVLFAVGAVVLLLRMVPPDDLHQDAPSTAGQASSPGGEVGGKDPHGLSPAGSEAAPQPA